MSRSAPRRTLLTAAVAAATTAAAPPAGAAPPACGRCPEPPAPPLAAPPSGGDPARVEYHAWTDYSDWRSGTPHGVRVVGGPRPGIVLDHPVGATRYTDPHTGRSGTWEYGTWTSPPHRTGFGATELVPSWNAHTPAGTWLQIELQGHYSDGTRSPRYVMGRWASGDRDIRRTSVKGQKDGRSTVWTDTVSLDDTAASLRLAGYRLRLTLYRRPGTRATCTVWRAGVMASAVPDRFTVPATRPGAAAGTELAVPRYSQEIHKGQYPEYDNGGEAWCSPTSTQMVLEHHGRRPTREDLAWVHPAYADPQICHAARRTYDWAYAGCGNWPFNTAYAAAYRDMEAVVTRLRTLHDAERLIRAGLPVITSLSFLDKELDGAGYGTAGHLMCVIGFTRAGNVIANDPAASDNPSVRRVYKRRQFENLWLRTKRHGADGTVTSGTGGICYLLFPRPLTAVQRQTLADLGIR